jgi:hypothetical protein
VYKIEKNIVKPYYETNRKKGQDKLYTYRTFKPNSYVIYPYKKENNKIELIELKELQSEYKEAFKYFNTKSIKSRLLINKKGKPRNNRPVAMDRRRGVWWQYMAKMSSSKQ